jgi:hypothetical protein
MKHSLFEVIILDIDNSVARQTGLIQRYGATVVPLEHMRSTLRWECTDAEMDQCTSALSDAIKTDKIKAVFYGSGDYHNVAHAPISIAMRHSHAPVSIVHFDNHTDWWKYKPGYHYLGNWVVRALDFPNIQKVYQFGVDGDLAIDGVLTWPSGEVHRMDLLLDGTIEMYPRDRSESLLKGVYEGDIVSGTIIAGPGADETRIRWKNFNNWAGLKPRIEDILNRMPTDDVYISIDKDALAGDQNFSAYGHFEGNMLLNEITHSIEMIAAEKNLIGIDICGDGSPPGEHTDPKKMQRGQGGMGVNPADYGSLELVRLSEHANLEILAAIQRGMDKRRNLIREHA